MTRNDLFISLDISCHNSASVVSTSLEKKIYILWLFIWVLVTHGTDSNLPSNYTTKLQLIPSDKKKIVITFTERYLAGV